MRHAQTDMSHLQHDKRGCAPGASAHGLSLYLSTKGDVSTKKISASCIAYCTLLRWRFVLAPTRSSIGTCCRVVSRALLYPLNGSLFKSRPATLLSRQHCRSMLATQHSMMRCRHCSHACQTAHKPAARLRRSCACQRRTLEPTVILNCRCRFQRQSRLVSSTDSCRQQTSDLTDTSHNSSCRQLSWAKNTWLAAISSILDVWQWQT